MSFPISILYSYVLPSVEGVPDCEVISEGAVNISFTLIELLVVVLIIGILAYIVLSIMKMPYTMLVAVIIGVTNVIPFFGPFIGAIPSFFIILLQDPMKSLYFLIFIFKVNYF